MVLPSSAVRGRPLLARALAWEPVREPGDAEVLMASLVHGGRTLASYDIVVTDAAGHRVCTARLTCLIRDQVPGRDGNGVDLLANDELRKGDHEVTGRGGVLLRREAAGR
jgi:hypothetical protein